MKKINLSIRSVLVALSLVFLLSSCKKKKTSVESNVVMTEGGVKEAAIEDEEIEEIYDGYTIILNAEVLEDDTFLINYLSELEEGNKFIKENNIITNVIGQEGVQSIEFKLPDDVYEIRRLRMNFGKNRNQNSMNFENITIIKGTEELELSLDAVNRYFFTNGYLAIDNDLETFTFHEKSGGYNPFILSRWSIKSLIDKKFN